MIVIATPARDKVEATFAYDLVQLIQHTKDVSFSLVLGTLLSNLRATLVKEAIKKGATHILFIDSDMRFPKDTVERLLAHGKDIVGANCVQRNSELTTARIGDNFIPILEGIERVDTIGFGVTLINLDVFKMKEPWFAMPFDGEKHVGEDVYFCHMAKEAGYEIFVDHDLGREIKHIGTKEYGFNRP